MSRTKLTGSDRIRNFLKTRNGKPASAAEVKASHSSLSDRNISSALREMPDVKQSGKCVCSISGKKVLAFYLIEDGEDKKKIHKTNTKTTPEKTEKQLTVKEKIRHNGARCTALEHAVEKQAKHIARLEEQIVQLKSALAKAVQQTVTVKAAVVVEEPAVESAPVTEKVEETVEPVTVAPENSPETAQVIAEISEKLSTFAELLRKLGAPIPEQAVLPSIKAKTLDDLKAALGDKIEYTERGKFEVGVEGEGFKIRFWLGAGSWHGKVNEIPVRGVGIKELLAVLPKTTVNATAPVAPHSEVTTPLHANETD